MASGQTVLSLGDTAYLLFGAIALIWAAGCFHLRSPWTRRSMCLYDVLPGLSYDCRANNHAVQRRRHQR
jgi:hypothetical protein